MAPNLPTPAKASGGKVAPAPDEKRSDVKKEGDEKDEEDKDDDQKNAENQTHASSSRKSKSHYTHGGNNDEKMKNSCQKCCGSVMKFLAHDAIYGSFVGPHPVSFLCLCALCKKRCTCLQQCNRPLCVASLATKLMNFIMLGVITLLATFFIMPWPEGLNLFNDATVIASFYPCDYGKMIKYKAANGGCDNHAGYFMAYRCFFAYATQMFINYILMLKVTSTKDDPYRARLHHGFWFYKYLLLFLLLLTYFLMVNGARDREGVFEFIASVIGNICHLVFSLIEITFIMDLVELWVYDNKTGKGRWATFIYWASTSLLFLIAAIVYIKIWVEFSSQRIYQKDRPKWPPWPDDNCAEGVKLHPDWKHTGLILGSTGTIMLLIIVMSFRKIFGIHKRFPYTGWLQTAIMILFNLSYLWSALMNSSNIHSRPHCNTGFEVFSFSNPRQKSATENVQRGSWDIYFEGFGVFHGILIVLSLLYFAFVHGPRSNTAPLSLLYMYLFQITDRIPVYPDEEDEEVGMPLGFLQAIDQSKVWDDEQVSVAQSWSLFYFMMVIGSLSLMMAMTNFTNPWAADHYNSSNVAFYCKFGTAVIATGIYIMTLISRWNSIQDYGAQSQKLRKRSVREVLEFDFEGAEMDEEEGLEGIQDGSKTNQGFKFYLAGQGKGRGAEEVNLGAAGAEASGS